VNYFAHAIGFLERPYFAVGTAVPDWLSVVDRRMRVRGKSAGLFLADEDPRVAELAGGICQHLQDDAWFHMSRAFAELSLELTRTTREALGDTEGFRPSFLGHILVEILLDAALIEDQPQALDTYYRLYDEVDARLIEDSVNRMATRTSDQIAWFVGRFCQERFLYDYREDAKLLTRLNHVMRRVGLPLLPGSFIELLPAARDLVRGRKSELLEPAP
jgi:hypothetical protein